mgnify:CR=1 FL=1
MALQVGDSVVVATYGQRLAGSTFGSVQWLGAGNNPFTVEYGAQALTLHVTTAVPVPGRSSWRWPRPSRARSCTRWAARSMSSRTIPSMSA